jgi:DNA-binding response OmpR family regulator
MMKQSVQLMPEVPIMILLAEDDAKIGKYLVRFLQQDGYNVDYAVNGTEALDYVKMNVYELVILDWMMPEKDGITVCRELRKSGYDGGILMLTARDTLENKVEGLEAGADDYLVKPFEYRELLARVKALARRSKKTLAEDILRVGHFLVDRATMTASKNGIVLNLSKREYQIFHFLLENHGRIVPRETLLDRIWGIDGEVTANNVDAYIRLLRKKVETKGEQRHIINVRGLGYKLEA